MNKAINLNNFFLGGIADSKYTGIANSLATIQGFDLHGEPGILRVNQKLIKESGSIVDEFVSKGITVSDGKTYFFGKTTGKIWSRTSAGTWTLEATNTNGGILNAEEADGYIYYAASAKLGRWQIGTAWAGRNDNFATFTNANTLYHPMKNKNLVLYIGDGYLLAQVDAGTFTANALDLEKKYIIKSLGEFSNDLLIGTTIQSALNESKVFRWNTYSVSFTNDDSVPENGVNCFLPIDNAVLVQCGSRGNIYSYNGEQLVQFKRISGNWTNTNEFNVWSEAKALYQGLPLFGVSNVSGNPVAQGVYSFGSYANNYPKVLNFEYIISQNKTTNIEITAIVIAGGDILVAWKDGSTYGVDKVDWSNKYASAFLETRMLNMDRAYQKDFEVKIGYRSLPVGTSITLQANLNNAGYTNVPLFDDAPRFQMKSVNRISGASSVQFKMSVTVNGNNAPEIENILLVY